jgi:hypothetical protein
MAGKRILGSLVIVAVLLWPVGSGAAEEGAKDALSHPDGEVSMTTTRVTLGLGYTWGEGALFFKGKRYKFKVSGLSVVGLGFTKVKAEGQVYNLQSLEDFPGKYFGVEAGATLIKGSAGLLIKNTKGVIINLNAVQKGPELKLGSGGLSIKPAWD